jgi:kynurenine formamidase
MAEISKLSLHSGTHVVAPSHALKDGETIDRIPLANLCVPCIVLDLTDIRVEAEVEEEGDAVMVVQEAAGEPSGARSGSESDSESDEDDAERSGRRSERRSEQRREEPKLPVKSSSVPRRAAAISAQHLQAFDSVLETGVCVLLKTFNSTTIEPDAEVVGLSDAAARYLIEKKIKTVGIDYLSVDEMASTAPSGSAQKLLLEGGITVIEGLRLTGVPACPPNHRDNRPALASKSPPTSPSSSPSSAPPPGHYSLLCLPLRLLGVDGSPARAILVKSHRKTDLSP